MCPQEQNHQRYPYPSKTLPQSSMSIQCLSIILTFKINLTQKIELAAVRVKRKFSGIHNTVSSIRPLVMI